MCACVVVHIIIIIIVDDDDGHDHNHDDDDDNNNTTSAKESVFTCGCWLSTKKTLHLNVGWAPGQNRPN